ncbi:MAG TPA: hypothetical protein VGU64_04160 [Terriglobales bacterium]|nr:hypothetical protein [Terriglobales bacterium]
MAVLLAAGDCFSADITTLDGKTYKDAQVTGVEADGVHISFRDGVVKVPFDQLPQELQRQYGYAPAKINGIAVKPAGTVKRVAGQMLANFPQSLAKNPMPIALLVGFVLLLTIAAGKWVKSRKRKQQLASRRDEYRKSDEWQRKRALILKRDKYRCVYCGARASRIHHKHDSPRNIGSEPIEWLVSVCERCHRRLDPDFE